MTATLPTEVDGLLETARNLTMRTDAFIDAAFVPPSPAGASTASRRATAGY